MHFLAFTVVAAIVIILVCPRTETIVIALGLLAAAVVCFSQSRQDGAHERLESTPKPAPKPAPAPVGPPAAEMPYPGAIDDEPEPARGPPRGPSRDPRGVCFDNEANHADIGGDELMANYMTLRPDYQTSVKGSMNRRRMMDPYLREELDTEESIRWWGAHEE